ncbi:hypothetical protein [Candidatus Odyssella acanthamoebae]|uniref:Uncharacterized protein n=1 Tax=Candidatus Odyssella acanthamoebae TaxID=91604 RepID=A0A077ASM8_9PROT|nr:hypothetical protein [Candidatus Paracaedibacter acanthamoebae]AIK96207.1 hypothetical protein ID47_04770 [Candidatus Paracaedibacter acanthamoebae]
MLRISVFYENTFNFKDPLKLAQQLVALRNSPQMHSELDVCDHLLLSNGLMFLFYKSDDKKSALKELHYCLKNYANNSKFDINFMEAHYVETMLELAVRTSEGEVLRELLENQRLNSVFMRMVNYDFYMQRYNNFLEDFCRGKNS